jgi:hypothetical protein
MAVLLITNILPPSCRKKDGFTFIVAYLKEKEKAYRRRNCFLFILYRFPNMEK